jgi:quercetin dioxygenase-like cupin family protein
MRKWLPCFALLAVCAVATGAQQTKSAHVLMPAAQIKWGAPPPVLDKSASFAVLAGDPGKPGIFVVRLKMPAGYQIAPHWHPTDEHVTVISGTFSVGMGEKMDKAVLKSLPAGGYVLLPAEARHFAMATTETIVQIEGPGPFVLNYVNPADDPSKKSK